MNQPHHVIEVRLRLAEDLVQAWKDNHEGYGAKEVVRFLVDAAAKQIKRELVRVMKGEK